MNEKRLYTLILGPHTTEKGVRLSDKSRQMAFRVRKDATKGELILALKKLFSVEVLSVQTVNVKGKQKQYRQKRGVRSDWKKAYVRLAPGHDINVADFQ